LVTAIAVHPQSHWLPNFNADIEKDKKLPGEKFKRRMENGQLLTAYCLPISDF
jgi:hypothetical protein